MCKLKVLIFMSLVLAMAGFCLSAGQVAAQGPPAAIYQLPPNIVPAGAMGFNPNVNYTLPNFSTSPNIRKFVDALPGLGLPNCTPGTGTPPNVTGGTCNQNALGQYIPIAVPDTTTYPGSSFYNMAVKQYAVHMSRDMPATGARGYLQVSGTGAGQANPATFPGVAGVSQFLGPLILARKYDPSQPAGTQSLANFFGIGGNGWPVRLKLDNLLPLSNSAVTCADPVNSPRLCLPVDTTLMGAGMGPMGPAPYGTTSCDMGVQKNCNMFTENRVTIAHLHGGRTPWISDGTPHQWFTPANDPIPGNALTGYPWGMKKGPVFVNVPDMIGAGAGHLPNTANDGTASQFYTDQQSARLMFWHDHAWGITRLNPYKGVAAGYLLVDQVEDDLIDGTNISGGNPAAPAKILPSLTPTGVYRYGIPLIILDRSFVNDTLTDAMRSPTFPIGQYDPTSHTYESTAACWNPASAGYYLKISDTSCGTDPLWYKYVGSTGGQFWMGHEYMPVENIYDPTGNATNGRWDYAPFMIPPMLPPQLTLPSPSTIPESFNDTMTVNGAAFPYLQLPPDVVRFRILSVGNDRSLNLSWFNADPLVIRLTNRGSGYAVPPAAPPVVTITPGAGDTTSTYTSATATVSSGVITGVTPARNCMGFTAPPTVTITGGGGTCSKTLTAIIPWNSNGQVADIAGIDSCTGFTSVPTITVSDGGGLSCNVAASIVPPGQILDVSVVGATGYSWKYATPTVTIAAPPAGTTATAVAFNNTEVRMVDAAPNPAYPTWPVDGRDGGVPDPTTQGPPWILIGNEGGLLAQASVIPPQPIDFEYVRQSIPFAGVTSHSLLMFPAHRTDVLVDFSAYKDGDTLILYNDGPAPLPFPWPYNDYYTDNPDLRSAGGQPTTPPGFGPNIRTVMQIRITGTKTSTFDFSYPNGASLAALKTAIPKAFAKGNDKPIIAQLAYNDAYPGFASTNLFAQAPDSTMNLSGTSQGIARIKTTAPGNNYTVAPSVKIIGDGTGALATAGLNPCGGITLLSAGSGYATPPTCTIGAPGAGGVQATCVATVSGGIVNAVQIDEPGSNYSTVTAATCTLGPPAAGGVQATCSTFVAVANTVGSITVTNPGSGYTREPRVYITPNNPNGTGASAVALLNGVVLPGIGSGIMTYKNITEGFDPDYGRMDIRLGSTPNPLTPSVGAAMIMGLNRYIDPPSEILNDGDITLWRITHLGVDSHALHFHLYDVQVVNRIDWTNVVKPPYPDEIGWRDTIRTNPMEDIVVAFRPHTVPLPFAVPRASRLLDPTTPVNSSTNFLPIAPPAGIAAVPQVTNIMTDFGWEYVFHCHMLGHEEFDFMRPVVFTGTPPAAPVISYTVTAPSNVVLTWPAGAQNTATTFTVQRATNSTFTTNLVTWKMNGTPPPTTYTDTTATAGSRFYYRVQASNTWGTSAWSNVVTVITVLAPSGLTGSATAANARFASVTLTWTNNTTTGVTGVLIQRATNAAFTGATPTNASGANITTRTITGLNRATTYYFRVASKTALGNSGWSNVFTITTP